MSYKLILSCVAMAALAAAELWRPAAAPVAADRPSAKNPLPTRPNPPVKPIPPNKPVEPAKPQEGTKSPPAEKTPAVKPLKLTPPMSDDAIQAGLAKKIELDLTAAPLSQAITALKTQTGLDIHVAPNPDLQRADDKPISAEPVVTIHVKDISAASALDLVLRDAGLSWCVDQGSILAAPADQLPAVTEVYSVRDLVQGTPDSDSADDADSQYDSLINLVTGVIQCPAWTTSDPAAIPDCNPFRGTLTVHQDQRIQRKVAGLLAALRKARGLKPPQYDAAVNRGLAVAEADDAPVVAALGANVEATFNGAKLEEVAQWIRKNCGIPVHIDATALNALSEKQAFRLSASGVPLKAMLDDLLPQAKLMYSASDEVLLISSDDPIQAPRSIRVYPIGDLIGADADHDAADDEFAQLLDSITHNIAPDTWATMDRQKSGMAYAAYLVSGRAIVCDQTRDAHDDIADLLAKLRKALAAQPAAAAAADMPKKRPLTMKLYKLVTPDTPAEDFVDVVKEMIEPTSWKGGEAYIHGLPGAIVVKQTAGIHKRVEKLLFELGAIPDPKKAGSSGTPTLVSKHKGA